MGEEKARQEPGAGRRKHIRHAAAVDARQLREQIGAHPQAPHRSLARQRHDELLRAADERSEEHTSELQSLAYLVCRLLLEKKKTDTTTRPVIETPDDSRSTYIRTAVPE